MNQRELTKREKATFEKITEAAKAAGANCRESITSLGTTFFDGIQHGEMFNILFVTVDKWTAAGYDTSASAKAKKAKKITKRFKNVTIIEDYHPHFYIFFVVFKSDLERSEPMKAKATAFKEAFHQERHRQNIEGEEDSAQKAIEAGHKAIEAISAA